MRQCHAVMKSSTRRDTVGENVRVGDRKRGLLVFKIFKKI